MKQDISQPLSERAYVNQTQGGYSSIIVIILRVTKILCKARDQKKQQTIYLLERKTRVSVNCCELLILSSSVMIETVLAAIEGLGGYWKGVVCQSQ